MKMTNILMAIAFIGGCLTIGQSVQAVSNFHPETIHQPSFCERHREACKLDFDHRAAGSCNPMYSYCPHQP